MRRLDPIEIEPDAWCGWCGDPLPEPEERIHNKAFCSVACRKEHTADLRKNPVRRLNCPHCGTAFKTTDPRKRFCTHRCARLDYKRRTRPKPPVPEPRTCPECGTTFQPKTDKRVFCCHTCACVYGNRRRRQAKRPTFTRPKSSLSD